MSSALCLPMKITAMSLKFSIACDQDNNFERGGTSLYATYSLSLTKWVCTANRRCKRRMKDKRVLSRAKSENGLFAQFSKAVNGVQLYAYLNQRFQILRYYLSLFKNGYFECKYDRAVLERHLTSKYVGYFKLAFVEVSQV